MKAPSKRSALAVVLTAAALGLALTAPTTAAAAPTAKALKEARQASVSCVQAKSGGDEKHFADYRAAKERAIKSDNTVLRELHVAGMTYGDLFAACDRDIPAAIRVRRELKGDRYAIWEREGDPDDFPGDALHSASSWDYRRIPPGTSFVCTIRYAFRGHKLVKKSKSGTGCVLVD
jgi:hypothetical protein